MSMSVGGSLAESQEAGNIVPATPKREREGTRSMVCVFDSFTVCCTTP